MVCEVRFSVRNEDDRRYLDYLDNQDGEKRGLKTKGLLVRETAPSTPNPTSALFEKGH
jgi:hypothetical protein